eukprot:771456-Prymnesium_polylepis.1
MREEDQHLDQPPATRRCTRCLNEGEIKSGEGWCCGSEGCGIEVLDVLRGRRECKQVSCGQLLRASHTGVSGPVRGSSSLLCARDGAPECMDPWNGSRPWRCTSARASCD